MKRCGKAKCRFECQETVHCVRSKMTTVVVYYIRVHKKKKNYELTVISANCYFRKFTNLGLFINYVEPYHLRPYVVQKIPISDHVQGENFSSKSG